jgi:nucleoside-diphosphate-sugar epimerase
MRVWQMPFWKDKKVLVTGGSGFIGSHLVEMLLQNDADVRVATHGKRGLSNLSSCLDKIDIIKGDLTTWEVSKKSVKDMDIVMHLAALVRGVWFMTNHPATIFTPNVLMTTQILEATRLEDVERCLYVSSACAYPLGCKIPISEDEMFKGPPESTYGWAKLLGEIQAQAYASEYGMRIAIVRPFNAYGPRDLGFLDIKSAHVIPALITKAVERQDPFRVWGSGEQTREFVYVTDICRGMLLATEKLATADPVNIGTGKEIKIKKLVKLILRLTGYQNANVVYDTTKPRGIQSRRSNIAKARKLLGYEPKVSLEEGLRKTIDWYISHLSEES